jgi:biotin operon repressor
MSFSMMAKAKPIKTGNSGRKLVLMMLADIADDTGRCFPSYQHIADVCEMSRRSVITHISKLVEVNLLNVTHRKSKGEMLNSSNIYQLTLNSEAKAEEKSGENFAPPSEMVALGSENSALGSEMVALGGSENSAPITYHSSYPINEPIKTNAIAVSDQLNQFEEFWKAYPKKSDKAKSKLAYAKAIKKASHELIIHSLINQKNSGQWSSVQFTPMATTWLNGERWEDDVIPNGGFTNGTNQQQPSRATSSDRMRTAANEFVQSLSQAQ